MQVIGVQFSLPGLAYLVAFPSYPSVSFTEPDHTMRNGAHRIPTSGASGFPSLTHFRVEGASNLEATAMPEKRVGVQTSTTSH